MRRFFSLSVILVLAGAANGSDNWPQFRGPNGDGKSDAHNVPLKWSETENIRWKVAIHDKGWSSPVIWGNQVWVTTAREDGKELFAVCVDRQTGKTVHDIKVISVENPAYCINYNSYASPTPVIEESRIYVHFGSAGTAALDTKTGKTLWKRHDLPCNHYRGPGSSPVVYKNLLILTFDGHDLQYVIALDKNTGKTVWKKDRNIPYSSDDGDLKKAYSTPSILELDGKPQLISPSAMATIAYDPNTGDEIWRVIHTGMNAAARPVYGHGLIFLTSGHTTRLLAVKQGGHGDLTKSGIAWQTNKGVPTRPSLLLVGDYLYVVSDNGIASCLEAKTGNRMWQERLGKATTPSPLYASGHIYFADEEGKTHVVAAGPKFKLEAVNQLAAGCMASPAALEGSLFIRTKTHLYCIASSATAP